MAKKSINKKSAKSKPAKVISVFVLLKKTWLELSVFWRPLGGIAVVYAVLYFVFVMGLSVTNTLKMQIDSSGGRVSQAAFAIIDSITNTYTGAESDATVLVQMLLFIVATLAVVWALRKLQALKSITIRDAYYHGPSTLIPVLLVSGALLLMLLPAILGSNILAIVLQTGSVGSEIIAVGIITGLLLFSSVYLLSMYWPAFYIASLPNMRPIQALRSARDVTKKRRLSIMRKLLALALLIVLFLLTVLFPFGLIAPAVVPYIVYVAMFTVFIFSQVYLYELYRSLL